MHQLLKELQIREHNHGCNFYRCGFKKHQLIPVRQKMQAANREGIDIRGAVFLTIQASGIITNVMVYVSPDVQGVSL